MNLREACIIAHGCGLQTVDEAVLNIEIHYPFSYTEEYVQLRELYEDLAELNEPMYLVIDLLGPALCEELRAEEEAFFNGH